jgi:glycosyltransferase involved in cell wall biosynthesis
MAAIQTGKTVCLITPGHIASNPRLVKEATALSKAGYKVHIIFTQYVPYLIDHDRHILNQNTGWTYDSLNWTGHNLSSKISRLSSKIMHAFSGNINIKINRNYLWQLKKAIACKADLYIAHNLGALPVTVIAAEKNKVKCGFDAEDFHRNEMSDDITDPGVILKTAIEEKYIPQLDYMIASSPQITAQYTALFNRDITTVINVFPKTDTYEIINNTIHPLKLFWFSQTIGPYRGLETIIEGINISNVEFDLHLLGFQTDEYKNHLVNLLKPESKCTLHFHSPVYAEELFNIAKRYDIGFASETDLSLNRTIALSNKVLTYVQSGLAVIVSNTTAQAAFINQYPQVGHIYNNVEELADILSEYNNDRSILYQTKQAAFNLGQTDLNWENESTKFITCVNNVIQAI